MKRFSSTGKQTMTSLSLEGVCLMGGNLLGRNYTRVAALVLHFIGLLPNYQTIIHGLLDGIGGLSLSGFPFEFRHERYWRSEQCSTFPVLRLG